MTTLLLQAKHKHTQFTSCAGCLTVQTKTQGLNRFHSLHKKSCVIQKVLTYRLPQMVLLMVP